MQIRRAQFKDITAIMKLLSQVLEIHASIRPDIFIPGTTKYTVEELTTIINDDQKAVFVAVDEDDQVLGYAFTQLQEQPFSTNMVQFKSLFIDDLWVLWADSTQRSQGVGRALLDYVKAEAKRLGCYEVTLNVWEGNDSAINFYKKNGLTVKETNMEFIL
ncbi:GNAT family N-acetyltransferase [Lactobacillus delbrueckii]|uniref:GNAT family N-acetyltransferase n=1 Tax=Lactobacillus delbrueckii TaxID=1584 RepID=UPI00046FC63A|nr:GNAT family N-acetyltransferase [Lactobacillus delbrueckii]APP09733.1 GNAT family N-acetyltransferase [Lactobacillus delbrueckii subsp. delbrueckii DSM 20074 = JCM 1012]KNZ38116.1 GNAT family acetyltransferase [Lactobacillus delbrueckii subsp. delbrueckii]MCT3493491.1 GNAT family N-acetyltransferase [Lactobacillus delbrueckii]MCT3521739.1 GNAT family N-acetyltransferase [Lactobacillus delbrueckii]